MKCTSESVARVARRLRVVSDAARRAHDTLGTADDVNERYLLSQLTIITQQALAARSDLDEVDDDDV